VCWDDRKSQRRFAFKKSLRLAYNLCMGTLLIRILFFTLSTIFGLAAALGALLWLMSEPFSFGGPAEMFGWIASLALWVLLPGAVAVTFLVCGIYFPRRSAD